MLIIKRRSYFERFLRHVESLKKHIDEGDYVQAAEKVWGALSSFVNAYSPKEERSGEGKKKSFRKLFYDLNKETGHLVSVLKRNNFKDAWHFASNAAGLHKYFFGARYYSDTYLSCRLIECYNVFKEIKNVVFSRK